ncbi:MAG: PilT/PilU family type 4a pilus ATPase [Planctomycetia bacterium]|nr:PilT/PilU family type 4a pilus ATPase [Planctomycetia bacterium]
MTNWTIDQIFKSAKKSAASDIHLVRGLAPIFRINGDLRQLGGAPLEREDLLRLLHEVATKNQIASFEKKKAVCFSRYWDEVGRLRITGYLHALCPEMAIRICESAIRPLSELGLPDVLQDFTRLHDGLVLITGPTGVGKTTTLNVMVDLINQEQRKKIIMIEDPVEFVHRNSRSIIVQQEVMTDTPSFHEALTNSLRQDPDVIVIGEMRSLETISTALTAAETGHLVFATLHTPDTVQTIQRVQSVFPSEQQNLVNIQLSNSIQAIVSQLLLPKADGSGRVVATEVCICNYAIRNKIRERNLHAIYNDLQGGRSTKMNTMDMSLLDLYEQGIITYETAITHARDKKFIQLRGRDL